MSGSNTIQEYGWNFDVFDCNLAKPNACDKFDFQIYGNTKGFPLASKKEDPKVCECYQGI